MGRLMCDSKGGCQHMCRLPTSCEREKPQSSRQRVKVKNRTSLPPIPSEDEPYIPLHGVNTSPLQNDASSPPVVFIKLMVLFIHVCAVSATALGGGRPPPPQHVRADGIASGRTTRARQHCSRGAGSWGPCDLQGFQGEFSFSNVER